MTTLFLFVIFTTSLMKGVILMIKFKQGSIKNMDGESKDIVVKAAAPNNLSDYLIGGGIISIGIAYLTITAFINGSKKFEEAEVRTMQDLGIM